MFWVCKLFFFQIWNLNAAIEPVNVTSTGITVSPASGSLWSVSGSTIAEQTTSTATVTRVAASTNSVRLINENTAQVMRMIYNDSSAELAVKFGMGASTIVPSFTVEMGAESLFEFPRPVYTGLVDGVWKSTQGSALITTFP